jgi:hypothetical protein
MIMNEIRNLNWFKDIIAPTLKGYEIKYKFFEEGDFGSLNQIEFNSESNGGEISFWSSGWLEIHFVDYIKGEEILNVFLEPKQSLEKEKALKMLQRLLTSNQI